MRLDHLLSKESTPGAEAFVLELRSTPTSITGYSATTIGVRPLCAFVRTRHHRAAWKPGKHSSVLREWRPSVEGGRPCLSSTAARSALTGARPPPETPGGHALSSRLNGLLRTA